MLLWHWSQDIAQAPSDLFVAMASSFFSGNKRLWWAVRSNEDKELCSQMRKLYLNCHIDGKDWRVSSQQGSSLSDRSHHNKHVCISVSLVELPAPWGHRAGLVYLWVPSIGWMDDKSCPTVTYSEKKNVSNLKVFIKHLTMCKALFCVLYGSYLFFIALLWDMYY